MQRLRESHVGVFGVFTGGPNLPVKIIQVFSLLFRNDLEVPLLIEQAGSKHTEHETRY